MRIKIRLTMMQCFGILAALVLLSCGAWLLAIIIAALSEPWNEADVDEAFIDIDKTF